MTTEKLQQIITKVNDRNEDEALQQAESIIKQIVREQGQIAQSNEAIVKLREELKKLSVTVVDPTSILGA